MRALLLLMASIAGCAVADDATLIVEVRTDLRSGVDFQDIRVRVMPTDAGVVERELVSPAPATRDLSLGHRVGEIGELGLGARRVEVALLDAEGEVFASRTASIALTGVDALMLTITRTCAGVVCPGPTDAPTETACLGGRCVSPACADGELDACAAPSLPFGEFLRQLGGAVCEAIDDCFGAVAATLDRGQDCPTLIARGLEESWGADTIDSLVEGRLEYHGEAAYGCLNAMRSSCAGFTVSKQHLECIDAMTGSVELGGACALEFDCAGIGTTCAFSGMCPGACVERSGVGGPCDSQGDCDAGVFCSGSGRCEERTGPGGPCESGDGSCRSGLLCGETDDGLACVSAMALLVGEEGDLCGAAGGGQLCQPGLGCMTDGTGLRCAPLPDSGGACLPGVPDPCPREEYCAGTQRCTPLPAEGEPCVPVDGADRCATGYECAADLGRVCVPWRGPGEACVSNAQCLERNCVAGACRSLCDL